MGKENKYPHYQKDVSSRTIIDIYDIAKLYEVTDHCEFHALKKILCAGKRGDKSYRKDIEEAIDSLQRRLEMLPKPPVKYQWHDKPCFEQGRTNVYQSIVTS